MTRDEARVFARAVGRYSGYRAVACCGESGEWWVLVLVRDEFSFVETLVDAAKVLRALVRG